MFEPNYTCKFCIRKSVYSKKIKINRDENIFLKSLAITLQHQ